MKKKLVAGAVTLLSVVTLAACANGTNKDIVTMKGDTITVSDFYNEIKNNQTTQNQANTQQAELDRLKAQLSQAQNEKQTAEDKLKQAEQLSAQDLNKAKAGLQKAQEELAKHVK